MKNTIFFLFLIITVSVSAQNQLLKGRIVDSATQDGIAYTNIGVEGTFFGTASDVEGFFELKIPNSFQDEKLYISAVGYKNETFLLKELLGKEFSLIKLASQTYNIAGIDVAAQSRVLFRVIKTASEQINENYMNGPMGMKIYYTESISTTGGNTETRDAIVELYDHNGYDNPSIFDAFQSQSFRFTQAKKNFESYSFPQGSTGFDELLEMNIVRSANTLLNVKLINDFDLQLEGTSSFDGDSVWIISYKTDETDLAHTGDYFAKKIDGKIYVSKSDYGIIRNECAIEAAKNNPQNRSLFTKGSNQKNVKYHFTSTYKKQEGKYSLTYLDCNKTYRDKNEQVISFNRKASVLEVTSKPVKIAGKNYFEDETYAESFWKNFKKPF